MKKFLCAAVLIVAVVATVGSSGETDSADSGASDGTTTTVASDGSAGDTAPSGPAEAGEADEVDDVKITACAKDETLGFAKATLEVTNNSSEASTYSIDVAFESPDGATQIGTGLALVTSLQPGQTTTEEVTSFEDPGDQEFTCKVTSVSRSAAL